MTEERLRYDQVSEIDMTAVDGLTEDQLREHFRRIAKNATAGQLRRFLNVVGEGDDDEADKPRYSMRSMSGGASIRC